MVQGATVEEAWHRTLMVIERLAKVGFKINVNKSVFLASQVEIMGHIVGGDRYHMGAKALK